MGVRNRSLLGRGVERGTLAGLLAAVRNGASSSLVLRGEAGIGKTALLDSLVEEAGGCRVLRAGGVQSEMELAFAGLHQLCAPLLERLDVLPGPQRDALSMAFGLQFGDSPDRFLVSLAALSLLSSAAEERPLVVAIDDAQWLDQASAQALAFVARRLQAESLVLVFAVRGVEEEGELAGLPELLLTGLGDADARELLASVVPGRLDERVVERIVAETQGNPLALLELPRGMAPAELAGGFGLDSSGLSGRIEESFRRRLDPLPSETRRLVLVAAAEPTGNAALLNRACALLEIDSDAAGPAEAADLLALGPRVTFSHPLVRSAVYRSATPKERMCAHRALAEATDPERDPDRRAWHRAQATGQPDEEVASELERSAARAQARGGLAAAAAFLEHAVTLTPEPTARAARALAAAEAKHKAGASESAYTLLAIAEEESLDELQHARAERLRAELSFITRRGADAPRLMLSAAGRLGPLDSALARETYLDALFAARFVGDREALLEVARGLRAAPQSKRPGAVELLLIGHAVLLLDGYAEGMEILRKALSAFRTAPPSGDEESRALWYACDVAGALWDDESRYALSERYVQVARDSGALVSLPLALTVHAQSSVYVGELAAAADLLEQADAITEAVGNPRLSDSIWILVGAWHDDEHKALERIEVELRDATEKAEEAGVSFAEAQRATLYNSLGNYQAALGAARRCCDQHPLKGYGLVFSDLVEAAARSGEHEQAAAAFELLRERTQLGGTDWALGVEARCRALLHEGEEAERLYREAIERLERTRARPDLARAHLLYGEMLRRERRRQDARAELRIAHELFTSMGARSFAARAERELLATGETARKRVDETRGDLTPQERQIARLARDGFSNAEIGARLFISPRTVEYHLRKVFAKLEIGSRLQLANVLASDAADQGD